MLCHTAGNNYVFFNRLHLLLRLWLNMTLSMKHLHIQTVQFLKKLWRMNHLMKHCHTLIVHLLYQLWSMSQRTQQQYNLDTVWVLLWVIILYGYSCESECSVDITVSHCTAWVLLWAMMLYGHCWESWHRAVLCHCAAWILLWVTMLYGYCCESWCMYTALSHGTMHTACCKSWKLMY